MNKIYYYITDRQMLNHKRDPISENENKQNRMRASSITPDALNYKLTRTGLIEKDTNGAERVRSLLSQNDELKKISEQEKEKYRLEMAAMLKRTTKLEECIVVLENSKIENEEEIQFLQKKVKQSRDRLAVCQQKHTKEVEQLTSRIKQLAESSESGGESRLEQMNKELRLELSRVKQQMGLKENEKAELVTEIKRMQSKWNSDIKQLQKQVETSQSQRIQVLQQYQQYANKTTAMIQTLNAELANKNSIIAGLQQKYSISQPEICSLKQNASSIGQRNEGELSKVKSELSRLKFQNNAYQLQLSQLKKLVSQKQSSISELERRLEQTTTPIADLTELVGKQEKARKQNQKLQEQQKQRWHEIEKQIIDLKSKIRMKQEQNLQLEESLTKWQAQYKKTAESRDAIEAQLMELKKQNFKLKHKSEENERKVLETEKQDQREKQNLVLREKQRQKMVQLVKQKERQIDKATVAQARIEKLLKENRYLNEKVGNLQIQLLEIQKSSNLTQHELQRRGRDYEVLLEQKIKFEASSQQINQLALKSQKLQVEISCAVQQKHALQVKVSEILSQLKNERATNEEILQQMESNREQYQSLLRLQSNKSKQLEQLTKCLKQKLSYCQKEYEKNYKICSKKTKELEQDKTRLENMVLKLREQIQKSEEQGRKGKKEWQEAKDLVNNKQKEYERKLRILEDQKAYLQMQNEKWKLERHESVQECEQLKRVNRRLKSSIEDAEQVAEKLKQKLGLLNQLESRLKQNQQQKIILTQKHEQEIKQLKISCEDRVRQVKQETVLLEEKLKAKISQDLQTVHREEVMRIRRKSEDCSFTMNRYEKKIEELEAIIDEISRNTKADFQGFKRQKEKRQRELTSLAERYEEAKKRSAIIQDELDDFTKKYREKQIRIEQLEQRQKKYLQSINELSLNASKWETTAIKWEKQNKNLEIKYNASTSETLRLENINLKFTLELEKIENSLKQIQKQKYLEEEKRKALEKTIKKLEAENQIKDNQIKQARKRSIAEKEDFMTNKKQQYQQELKKKAGELSGLKKTFERVQNQMRTMKEKVRGQQKNRKDLYYKLTELSSQHFAIEGKQNQLEFLNILYEKVKQLVEIMRKLKMERSSMHNRLKVQNEELLKSYNKNYDEEMSIKDNYNLVYNKYLKYKEAYIYCKTKLERQKIDVVNDQRFTEEILSHCKTLIPKIQ